MFFSRLEAIATYLRESILLGEAVPEDGADGGQQDHETKHPAGYSGMRISILLSLPVFKDGLITYLIINTHIHTVPIIIKDLCHNDSYAYLFIRKINNES